MELGFHTQDGLYFQRGKDGSVVATRATPEMKDPSEVQVLFVLDANSWASVVAHVSRLGSTSEGFAAASALHLPQETAAT